MKQPDLVADLKAHFGMAGQVELTETTKSWIFATADKVFKLKKRVRDDLQDLTSLSARHDNTLTEIDLNRRLAATLYVGAIRVGRTPDGRIVLDQPGAETVDWLVEMHRLPADLMLDAQIIAGAPHDSLTNGLEALVPLMLTFYRTAPATRLTASELMTVHNNQLQMARRVLLDPAFAAYHARILPVLHGLEAGKSDLATMLADRVRVGAIVECHGDLRPEHVCLSDPPLIYDCLEFNRTLRLSDPFSEVVYLGMECAMLGADWIGPQLITALEAGLGSVPNKALLQFYEAHHAVVRARLCFAHLLVPTPRTPEKWIPLGLRYLDVAERSLS